MILYIKYWKYLKRMRIHKKYFTNKKGKFHAKYTRDNDLTKFTIHQHYNEEKMHYSL